MNNSEVEIGLLFETSWEVCNKVGGIYTVLSSKAKTLKERYKDKLIFIGPDVWSDEHPSPYFTEVRSLLKDWVLDARLPEGVDVRVGRWDIPGRPIAILIKFDGMYAVKDEAYARMWELYGVDSLHAYGDYDEGCAFARAAAIVIESIVRHQGIDPKRVLAHFDEWTTGMGLLKLKDEMPEIATVFTTHATSIGRSICGNGKPLYDQLKNYNGDQMAGELNMQSKHSLEKAAAQNADCFTTVSDVTASEAEQLLERKADIVTPNGFEANFVPKGKAYTAARAEARTILMQVATALTGSNYNDDTFIVATSGRQEYRNKGLDMFIDVMKRVGQNQPKRKVLAFILVPGWTAGPREDLQHKLAVGEPGALSDAMITHVLNNYNEDPVNHRIHSVGFNNGVGSFVDVIYVPCYLDGADGIFNKTYYDLLPGLDATVFASYYEPWGYTPLESISFGVPTITTTLAGFGAWVNEIWPSADYGTCGVRVARRTDSNYGEAVEEIARDVEDLIQMTETEGERARKSAKSASAQAAWSKFMEFYDAAYHMALENRDSRIK